MSSAAELPNGLLNFFIYNIEYGQREGTEEEKVMFYTPPEVPLGKQINAIGLCQAIAQFVNGFNPTKPCECLTTQKTKQYFFNAEGSFWMVMTLAVPFTEKVSREKKVLEYHPDLVQDNFGKAILKQTYDMFVLFNGGFFDFVKKHSVEALKDQFKLFYYRYLQTINFQKLDILDVFQGIDYLPLEKVDFLRVQCFVNLVENTFGGVRHLCFLHNENIVWTTLQLEDMKILYKYLTSRLFPASNETEQGLTRSSPVSTAKTPTSNNAYNFPNPGRFLTAPKDYLPSSPMTRLSPRIFVSVDGKTTELYLIVYKAQNSVLCFLVEPQSANAELCNRMHNFVGPQLGNLSNIISEQNSKRMHQTNNQYRFVYFNSMNLAIRSSIHNKSRIQGQSTNGVSSDIMNLLVDIHQDLNIEETSGGEIASKLMNDCWVVGKHSGFRQFYVVFNQKSSTLVEICEELQRLMNTGFGNILFLE